MDVEPKNVLSNDRMRIEPLVDYALRGNSARKRTHGKRRHGETFEERFAKEIDIFDQSEVFPRWIYGFREKLLIRFGKTFREVCELLRREDVNFKVRYPVEIEGEWKFADFFLPEQKAVVILEREREVKEVPFFSKTQKVIWFERKYKVLAIEWFETWKLPKQLRDLKREAI